MRSTTPKNSSGAPSRRTLLAYLAAAGAAAPVLAGCGFQTAADAGAGNRTIRLISSQVKVYEEPVVIAGKLLAQKGWKLEPTFVNDINQPNIAVANGEAEANCFQHMAYLAQFNRDKNLDLVPLFYIRNSPAVLYSQRHTSLADLPDGATISIPVDPANNGRALFMLRAHGLLELSDGAKVVTASQQDITANPRNLKFVEVDQLSLSQTLADVDAGFMFQSTAIDAGIHEQAAVVAQEQEEDEIPYRSVFAGTRDFAAGAGARELRAAIQSPEVREFFAGYQDGFFQLPWDEDPQPAFEALSQA
ncbi:D-methionine transport system substrate-binding protein [Arthrobacter sp. UYP6]|uniref:MetQ/NlpA family ABC transporter substrate-binding protein n=1 Tax=Arthrobacter sp. UYP6 TaxID=1756378 RepID=UPI0033934286